MNRWRRGYTGLLRRALLIAVRRALLAPVIAHRALCPLPNSEASLPHGDSPSKSSPLGGSGVAMKDFQGDHINAGRHRSHNQCENHGCDSAYADEWVALPDRNLISASQLKYETPDDHRCRPDENPTEQDSPDSPFLCILDCKSFRARTHVSAAHKILLARHDFQYG